MTPTHTRKGGKQYPYYVCLGAQKRGWKTCPSKSVPAGEIERFVVDQIRCIGRDPALRKEVLQQLKAQEKTQRQELQEEKRRFTRALKRHSEALIKLVGKEGKAAKMEALLGKIRGEEASLGEVMAKLAGLRQNKVDEAKVEKVLAQFDPLWDTLTHSEKVQVLRIMIRRIDFDGDKNTVSIEFHETGFQALAGETGKEEAA
jgi:site-specific DNA recombinase